ncbi:MAG: hypothetical protein AAGM45_12910 [Cyanobacteria bacterium J06588_5]
MPDKQKVTLYLPNELHRQFKIRSAVDGETMSSMARRALEFYLTHSDLVQNGAARHGRSHQIHSCPQCDAAVTLSGNDLRLVHTHADYVVDDLTGSDLAGLECIPALHDKGRSQGSGRNSSVKAPLPGDQMAGVQTDSESSDEGELITC